MATPTIDSTQSILGYRAGESFSFQPGYFSGYTTDLTCTFTATGLPSGMSISSSTGLISCNGTVTPGVYVVGVRATNKEATPLSSAVAFFTIGIEASDGSVATSGSTDTGIDVNIDVASREVALTVAAEAGSAAAGEDVPIFLLKEDDAVLVNVRFKKNGVALDPTLTSLKFAFKEIESEGVLFTAGGAALATTGLTVSNFAKVGSGATAYFQVLVTASGDALVAALSNYEADGGTKFNALFEAEWKQDVTAGGGTAALVASSKTKRVTIERDLIV